MDAFFDRSKLSVVKRRGAGAGDKDSRAFSADAVLINQGLSISIQHGSGDRLAATTGSYPTRLEQSLDAEEAIPLRSGAGELKVGGSITPKSVGKYLSDCRRVQSIVASSRSVFNRRRRPSEGEGGQDAEGAGEDSFFSASGLQASLDDDSDAAYARPTGTFHSPQHKGRVRRELGGGESRETASTVATTATLSPERDKLTDAFAYLAEAEVPACSHPARDIERVVTALPVQDWPEIFGTLNLVRSLAVHHAARLAASGALHSVVAAVLRLVDNLRSAVAKNAMLALGELYRYSGPGALDVEAPKAIDAFIKVACNMLHFFVYLFHMDCRGAWSGVGS